GHTSFSRDWSSDVCSSDLQVMNDSTLCGTCPGPCVNFCDRYAIRYTPDPDEFEVLKARTLGEMTEAEAAEALAKRKEERAAAKADRKRVVWGRTGDDARYG